MGEFNGVLCKVLGKYVCDVLEKSMCYVSCDIEELLTDTFSLRSGNFNNGMKYHVFRRKTRMKHE